MKTLKTHLAVAAALAALSLPALAAEPGSSVTGDPTFPSLDNPAPAMTLRSDGSRSSVLSDPTFPEVATVAPAARLTPYVSDVPAVDPAEYAPVARVALIPEAAPQQVAASR